MQPVHETQEVVRPFLSAVQRDILIAAAGGSLLSLLFLGEKFTWKIAATAIFSGMFCSYYTVELIATSLKLDAGWCGALGAGMGFAAMTILGGIFKLLRLWRDDPTSVLARVVDYIPFLRKRNGG